MLQGEFAVVDLAYNEATRERDGLIVASLKSGSLCKEVYKRQDLNEAEGLLKEVEEKGMNDEFFSYRQNRLNYWAVLALKARFYLWIQDKPKAAEYAGRVIANKNFRLNQGGDFAAKDNIASPEHLFSLHVYNLNDIVSGYFLNAGGVQQDQNKVKTDIFESDVTDFRPRYLWNEVTEKAGTRYIPVSYTHLERLESS